MQETPPETVEPPPSPHYHAVVWLDQHAARLIHFTHGDRPQIRPKGWNNLAFIGQFCEQPDDVVFTVEYSVRSAQTAVYSLLGLDLEPPDVYKGHHDPNVLYDAFKALHDTAS